MQQIGRRCAVGLCLWAAMAQGTRAQIASAPGASPAVQAVTGGKLHGVVKSGNVPLPGVTVTAQDPRTGKKYATTTGITGAWSMAVPNNGRYVIRTEFAGFAQGAGMALLNASSHDQMVNFDLMLASRAAAQEHRQAGQSGAAMQSIRHMPAKGPQNLDLMSALTGDATAGGEGDIASSGAALPSAAGDAEFSSESVNVNGQAGQVSPLAGLNMDRIGNAIEDARVMNGGQGFAGRGGMPLGGPGGFAGGFIGGRFNFRAFNPAQPHGAVFWTGSNFSELDAEPFSLLGQHQIVPASGTNQFGITLMTAPYIPHLTKPSGKDNIFLNVSGTRSAIPQDQYATVPTNSERSGTLPGLSRSITPVAQAEALLNFIPQPNLPGDTLNYHLLTTAQTNSTRAGVRYMRSFGASATPLGFGGRGGGFGGRRGQVSQGLRQSINLNYNWSHQASDNVNILPILGGKTASDSYSVQAGYTIGRGKVTSIFNANWNRSNARTTNFFTSGVDIATQMGIDGPGGAALNVNPLNYGVPSVTMSEFTGISEVQPSFSIAQTISASETLVWRTGKHNLRFGGDFRRVHQDFLGGSNATGTFYFTGAYSGSAFGDFLLGEPQETSIAAAAGKSYLRDNVIDWYAQDDWRARPNFTLMYGIRYEYFAPYTEKYNHMAMVDTNPEGGFTNVGQVSAGQASTNFGTLPASMVYPFRTGFSPRGGFAWRLPKQTVIRGGYGMNYTVGEYATFARSMAYQPPFANEQTNIVNNACAPQAADCYTLGNGFPAPNPIGNYAVNPHYRLPYVQVYNVDVQKTLPWGIVMNLGYNGSHGSNLDVKIAPNKTVSSPGTNPNQTPFFYETYGAFSRYNAATVRVNKRMSKGVAVGANYQYAHSIDDADSVGGLSSVVAQNWQNIAADEGNSNFDVRHRVGGSYLYELPLGKDKFFITTGKMSHVLEGFSISGDFTFATGTPLTPTLQASVTDAAHGTIGTERPDRVSGVPLMQGGGRLKQWFNPAAFKPVNPDAAGNAFGNASRNSIPGPGTVENDMSLSKTMQLGETRSMEIRATANNVFNTVQYSGVFTTLYSGLGAQQSSNFGQVSSAGQMRAFAFVARFRF